MRLVREVLPVPQPATMPRGDMPLLIAGWTCVGVMAGCLVGLGLVGLVGLVRAVLG